MRMQVANKVALITGSGKGLGKAFAGALLARGARVCLSDVDPKTLQATYDEYASQFGKENVCSTPCDVTVESNLKDVFAEARQNFKGLDIVVNNAGIADESTWDKMVDINLKGVMRGTLMGMDAMKSTNGGKGGIIINIASMAGLLPVGHVPAYTATKHGVVAYTKSWAINTETLNNNIRLVCLCPAYTDTDIIKMPENAVCGKSLANASLQELGVMSVDTVVAAFLKLLDDSDNHGKALSVMKGKGMQYF
ncbi:15-hydroxyprostaglandin dehydrogenase [NAD(+)]-like isoform X2 [Mizuhopecten yessoensis]|uniref:15-hydroxyprostaglandin dehydrogenase [NAD(+)] n=1 Tax=Mizuhopecten yessoensis TaxID=6573 RepID=A0A210PMR8_MIZYE|nr:15-hydroxyprostaglandin dehydrogenase [NAD(+)]-like isoform X1 [Mizuhopecten yessoensis]XP_021379590.1 15-hydroxyprostaglandin dehydrogenase [NAD(+)]-like isoform X2 [Mizuhopecten yessoensis]OWF37771.1 15-hydroxyprostaglandin dehydrogenase [NAD(+)] [Mizuhopecten yessoensis]